MKIVLASQSPRRQEILEMAGYSFEVCPSSSEEVFDRTVPIDQAIQKVAYQKAKDIQGLYPECCILSADTIVLFENEILGKPKDIDQARELLKRLSNHTHEVKTGVCVLLPNQTVTFTETTQVHFRNLSSLDIENYLKKGTYIDKAGAYGIQECDFSDWIDGSYHNVVGLPIETLEKVLEKLR